MKTRRGTGKGIRKVELIREEKLHYSLFSTLFELPDVHWRMCMSCVRQVQWSARKEYPKGSSYIKNNTYGYQISIPHECESNSVLIPVPVISY